MTLERFLRDNDWTESQLAAEVRKFLPRGASTHQSTINRLRTKRHGKASLALALAIEKATGGAVRAGELPLSKESKTALQHARQIEAA